MVENMVEEQQKEAEQIEHMKNALKQYHNISIGYFDKSYVFHSVRHSKILKYINELEEKVDWFYEQSLHSDTHALGQMREIERLADIIQRQEGEIATLRKAKVIYETVDYCAHDLAEALKEIKRMQEEIVRQGEIIREKNKEIERLKGKS